jgi:hypothetical protein
LYVKSLVKYLRAEPQFRNRQSHSTLFMDALSIGTSCGAETSHTSPPRTMLTKHAPRC